MKKSTPLHPKQVTLEYVASQFENWRKNKIGRAKAPKYLWDLLHQLKEKYPRGKIASTLRLSTSQMRAQGFYEKAPIKSGSASFIKVSSLPPTATSTVAYPSITVERKDGTQCTLNYLSLEQIFSFLQSFIG